MKKCETCKANKICDHNNYGFENCGNYISADVVEVVRCKDCEHYRGGACFKDQWWNDDYATWVNEQDFCSYGERKSDENNS